MASHIGPASCNGWVPRWGQGRLNATATAKQDSPGRHGLAVDRITPGHPTDKFSGRTPQFPPLALRAAPLEARCVLITIARNGRGLSPSLIGPANRRRRRCAETPGLGDHTAVLRALFYRQTDGAAVGLQSIHKSLSQAEQCDRARQIIAVLNHIAGNPYQRTQFTESGAKCIEMSAQIGKAVLQVFRR